MSSPTNSPPLFAAIRKAVSDKYSLIIWFVAINVFIGSAGVWVPLIPEIKNGWGAVDGKFLEVLRSGGAYTFVLAYLAATSWYVITEYVEDSDEHFRAQKAVFGAMALIVGMLCCFFTMDLLSRSDASKGLAKASIGDWLQVTFTVIGIVVGFCLALLQWAGGYSLDALLDKSQADEKSKAKQLMSEARAQGSGPSKNAIQVKGKTVRI